MLGIFVKKNACKPTGVGGIFRHPKRALLWYAPVLFCLVERIFNKYNSNEDFYGVAIVQTVIFL